jgi:DNA-damage-inducible protein J
MHILKSETEVYAMTSHDLTEENSKETLEEEVPNEETIAAMEEGRRIASDPNVKGYSSMEELKKALEE